jgi:hypothetical protein
MRRLTLWRIAWYQLGPMPTSGEQASSHLDAIEARNGQFYADPRFCSRAVLTSTRVEARTVTVSKVREKAGTSTYTIKG